MFCLLWNADARYHVLMSPPLVLIRSQRTKSTSSQNFHLRLRLQFRSLNNGFIHWLSHMCYISA